MMNQRRDSKVVEKDLKEGDVSERKWLKF